MPPPVRAQGFLGPGQSVAIITPGAGGYGDPRERDRALVRRDLDEGVVSEAVAREAYGLAQDPALTIDSLEEARTALTIDSVEETR